MEKLSMSNDSKNDHDMPTCLVLQCGIGDFKVKNCWSKGSSLEDGKKSKKTTPVKVKKTGVVYKDGLFFTGAAAAGRLLVFLFLHGAGLRTLGTFFWFAPAFLGGTTLFTLEYSHFVSPLNSFSF
jgi:hypothetical protein